MSTVWGTFTSTIRWLAARTLVGLVLLMLDRDNAPNRPLELLGIGIWVVAIFRLIWAIWILEQLVALLAPTARKSDTGSDRD